MQGVSIIFAVKNSTSKKLASVYHYDSYGKRDIKYERLEIQTIEDIKWEKLIPKEPYYFFVPKDFALEEKYNNGVKLDQLFSSISISIETQNDVLTIRETVNDAQMVLNDFKHLSEDNIKTKYSINKE